MQMNYIVTQSNIPKQSPYHSAGGVDQALGSADDYISSDDRIEDKASVGCGLMGI